jgi:hypothetical protein
MPLLMIPKNSGRQPLIIIYHLIIIYQLLIIIYHLSIGKKSAQSGFFRRLLIFAA